MLLSMFVPCPWRRASTSAALVVAASLLLGATCEFRSSTGGGSGAPPEEGRALEIFVDTTLTADVDRTVTIAADGVALDCDGHSIRPPVGYSGIVVSKRQGVLVTDCVVVGAASGFSIDSTSESDFLGNTVAESRDVGFRVETSDRNLFERNAVTGSGDDGFFVRHSDDNEFIDNVLASNGANGARFELSNGNVLMGNVGSQNRLQGIRFDGAVGNAIVENTIDRNGERGVDVRNGSNQNAFEGNVACNNPQGDLEVLGSIDNGFCRNAFCTSNVPDTGAPCAASVRSVEVNRAPVARAGPDQTVECEVNERAFVRLDGSGSFDPDGDALRFSWGDPFGSASGPTTEATLGVGATRIALSVEDDAGVRDVDELVVTVADSDLPEATVWWRPISSAQAGESEVVTVELHATCWDRCDPLPRLTLTLDERPVAQSALVSVETNAALLPYLEARCIDSSGNVGVAALAVDVIEDRAKHR